MPRAKSCGIPFSAERINQAGLKRPIPLPSSSTTQTAQSHIRDDLNRNRLSGHRQALTGEPFPGLETEVGDPAVQAQSTYRSAEKPSTHLTRWQRDHWIWAGSGPSDALLHTVVRLAPILTVPQRKTLEKPTADQAVLQWDRAEFTDDGQIFSVRYISPREKEVMHQRHAVGEWVPCPLKLTSSAGYSPSPVTRSPP